MTGKREIMRFYVKKIEFVYCLMKGSEIIEAYDTRPEAEFALFDATRGWGSLWDVENA